jgi:hypothetical protein
MLREWRQVSSAVGLVTPCEFHSAAAAGISMGLLATFEETDGNAGFDMDVLIVLPV